MRTARTRTGCLAVAVTAVLAACAGDRDGSASSSVSIVPNGQAVVEKAPESTVDATTLPATDDTGVETRATAATVVSDVAKTTVTTAVPVTAPPSTVAAVAATLPIPVAVPVDSRGEEPIIDLGTIEIPKIGLKTDMYEGIRLTTLDRGPGHWPGTAMPGAVGNVVVAGHRVSHDKPFRKVDQLVAGDQVIFTTADGVFTYSVTSLEIVTPDAISIIDQTADKTATLFACHPPGSTRERIVVHLALVET